MGETRTFSRLETDPEFKRRVHELKDKTLGCFCKPHACHGDVITEYLDNLTAHARELDPRHSRELHEISGGLMNRVKIPA